MQDTITRRIDISAPLERVWELVSVPGWWVTESSDTAGDRTPGSVSVVQTERGTKFPIEVVDVTPQTYVAFRWASQFPDTDLADGRSTLIEFTLTPSADGVQVTVVESGFATLDAPAEVREAGIADNTSGWEQMLGLLSRHATS